QCLTLGIARKVARRERTFVLDGRSEAVANGEGPAHGERNCSWERPAHSRVEDQSESLRPRVSMNLRKVAHSYSKLRPVSCQYSQLAEAICRVGCPSRYDPFARIAHNRRDHHRPKLTLITPSSHRISIRWPS